MKTLLVIAIAVSLCGSVAYAVETSRFRMSSSKEAVEKLPCSMFEKGTNGSWTVNPNVTIEIDGGVMSNDKLSNTPESRVLDKRCGQAAKPKPH